MSPYLLSLALGASAAVLPLNAGKDQLLDVLCSNPADPSYQMVVKQAKATLVGERTLVLVNPSNGATLLYMIPDGTACSIAPHLKPNGEPTN